jgi:hypothetical protein
MEINLSSIDRERFGINIAKVNIDAGDSIEQLCSKAQFLNVQLLIVRMPTEQIALAQDIESKGAFLADTLVYFQKKKIDKYECILPLGYQLSEAEPGDADDVGQAAAESFKGYYGHYHADRFLNREDCDAVYSSWAKNSCKKEGLADKVLLIKKGNEIAAFATLKTVNTIDFEGVLFGVTPSHQGKGLYLTLMQQSQNWGLQNGKRRLLTSTQINNVTVQKSWCRVGMEPLNSFYTFHLWMDK